MLDMGLQESMFALLGFDLALVHSFPCYAPIPSSLLEWECVLSAICIWEYGICF
jgi:hypothetical protein